MLLMVARHHFLALGRRAILFVLLQNEEIVGVGRAVFPRTEEELSLLHCLLMRIRFDVEVHLDAMNHLGSFRKPSCTWEIPDFPG